MVELPAFCCIAKHGYITNKNICENRCDNLSCAMKPSSSNNYLARKRLQQTVNKRNGMMKEIPN